MQKENIETFLGYGKELDSDAVLYILVGQIIVAAVGMACSYNRIRATFLLLPFLLTSIILYIVFRRKVYGIKRKQTRLKYINLYLGVLGLLTSLTSQCASLMCIKVTGLTLAITICILLLSNGLVALGMSMYVYRIVNSKKRLPAKTTVSVGIIAACGLLGTFLGEQVPEESKNLLICIALAILSLIFSIFICFIQKYYYFNLLEKQEEGERDF